jgi:ribose transport system substrate-binding protein
MITIISNHRQRLVLSGIAMTAAAALMAGCGTNNEPPGPGESGTAGQSKTITVGMVTPESTGEYYGTMYCGAEAAAADQGVTAKIQGTPEVTAEAEMAVIQSVIATNPDGMILATWDNNAFNAVMKTYVDAGNPLVMTDSFLSDDNLFVQSIRTDSYQSSYDGTLEVLKRLAIDSGKALVITDTPGNQVQSARAEGFRDALEKNTGLEVLEFQYVGGDAAKASQAVSSAQAANTDLAIVFATNIPAGTGAANGIRTSGKDIALLGYDAAKVQVDELKAGEYDALIAQNPYEMGYEAMTLISKILKGETSADSITDKSRFTSWAMITADNVDDPGMAQFLYNTDCSAFK